ncbi:DUF2335 domain-containing protein [Gemmata sp. SH-PL17]|uniref:DUF2335 domain-containing protein n=1 Tax=Gemmata sp. SH-PL17 TaxID=1630693 RepID=UPI0012F9D042|nr:DUF2335 domain-containing protein [Gemmata sp. SH-PL17]
MSRSCHLPTAPNLMGKTKNNNSLPEGFPDPTVLERYNAVIPNFSERFMAQWEAEAEHRRDQENRRDEAIIADQRSAYVLARWGQICGLAIGLFAIAVGGVTAYNSPNLGSQLAGGFIGGGGVIGLVSVFVIGKRWPVQPESK